MLIGLKQLLIVSTTGAAFIGALALGSSDPAAKTLIQATRDDIEARSLALRRSGTSRKRAAGSTPSNTIPANPQCNGDRKKFLLPCNSRLTARNLSDVDYVRL